MSFGTTSFAVYLFSHATDLLKMFSTSINKVLLEKTNGIVEHLNGKFETNMKDYDMVYGISGILNYLLEFDGILKK